MMPALYNLGTAQFFRFKYHKYVSQSILRQTCNIIDKEYFMHNTILDTQEINMYVEYTKVQTEKSAGKCLFIYFVPQQTA